MHQVPAQPHTKLGEILGEVTLDLLWPVSIRLLRKRFPGLKLKHSMLLQSSLSSKEFLKSKRLFTFLSEVEASTALVCITYSQPKRKGKRNSQHSWEVLENWPNKERSILWRKIYNMAQWICLYRSQGSSELPFLTPNSMSCLQAQSPGLFSSRAAGVALFFMALVGLLQHEFAQLLSEPRKTSNIHYLLLQNVLGGWKIIENDALLKGHCWTTADILVTSRLER